MKSQRNLFEFLVDNNVSMHTVYLPVKESIIKVLLKMLQFGQVEISNYDDVDEVVQAVELLDIQYFSLYTGENVSALNEEVKDESFESQPEINPENLLQFYFDENVPDESGEANSFRNGEDTTVIQLEDSFEENEESNNECVEVEIKKQITDIFIVASVQNLF